MSSDKGLKSFDAGSSQPNEDDQISDDSIYNSQDTSQDDVSMDDSAHEDLAEYSHTLKAMKVREDMDLTRNLLKVAQGKDQDEGRYQSWTRWPLLPEDVPRSHLKSTTTNPDSCHSPLGQEILATAEKCIKEHLSERHLEMDADELDPSIQNAVVSTGIDDVQRMLDVCRVFRRDTKDANRQRPLDWKSMLRAAELSGLPKEAIDAARNKLTKIYEPTGQPPPDRLAIMYRLLAENDRHMANLSSESYTTDQDQGDEESEDDLDDESVDELDEESEDEQVEESEDEQNEESEEQAGRSSNDS